MPTTGTITKYSRLTRGKIEYFQVLYPVIILLSVIQSQCQLLTYLDLLTAG